MPYNFITSLSRPKQPLEHWHTNKTLQRRRAQNRDSQRAFRARRERRLKELETKLATLTALHEKLCVAHTALMNSIVVGEAFVEEGFELLK